MFVLGEEFKELLPELFDANFIFVVADAYLVVGVVNCCVCHFLDFCVKFSNQVFLDFRLL